MLPPLTEAEEKLAADFKQLFYARGPLLGGGTWARTFWLGSRILKCPFDLWLYQDIIGQLQPELIIECGTGDGGSALYFASLFSLIDRGHILTIDVNECRYRDPHPRITRIVGSSVAQDVVGVARNSAVNRKTMVILDSDHSYDHVTHELHEYASLVTPGSYLVIEDTNISETQQAAARFISTHPEFEVDPECEKYLVTFNTWLRRKS